MTSFVVDAAVAIGNSLALSLVVKATVVMAVALVAASLVRRPSSATAVFGALVLLGVVAPLRVVAVTHASALRAQSGQKFEVASVRRVEILPAPNGVPVFPTTDGIGTGSPHRITYRATWLKPLIAEAFGVRVDQIAGPAWLDTARYDIVANIPQGATKDDFKLMLADLLRERFRLRVHMDHMDARVRPIYALRVGKNGPKITPTTRTGDATVSSGVIGAVDAQGCPILPPDHQGMLGRATPVPGEMCWSARDVAMANLVPVLEWRAGRAVLDETGLTGRYDFTIRFQGMSRAPDAGAAFDAAPSVFTAVEEQLGLKLEPGTSSFPALIIDAIEREPTEN